MDLNNYFHNNIEFQNLQRSPNLRCSSYLAYPEFEEYVEGESDIQLIFCIRELYDYLYNEKMYINNKYINKHEFNNYKKEFLNFVSEVSSIISVCLETKLDRTQSKDIHDNQILRLKEQEKNIEKIKIYTRNNEVLFNLVNKISNSIKIKLYCLFELNNQHITTNMYELDTNLTPLRIKYPYLTGTYVQIYKDQDININDNKININDLINNKQINDNQSNNIKILNFQNTYKEPEVKTSCINNNLNDYNVFNTSKQTVYETCELNNNIELTNSDNDKNSNTVSEDDIIMEKFSGGATRIIVNNEDCINSDEITKVDGWGLIQHHIDNNQLYELKTNSNSSKSKNLKKNSSINQPKINLKKKKVQLLINNDDNIDGSISDKIDFDKQNFNKLKNVFEKKNNEIYSSNDDDTLYQTKDQDDCEKEDKMTAQPIINKHDKNVSTYSHKKSQIKYESSYMPSQSTSTRQLSNYRDTMYSTSSWLPLIRNTGFNLDCINSNSHKTNNKNSSSEYDPAAEYARFSDAVGKVIHPVVADESYRDNGKNIMNPKKLFNVKFGTLTEDSFREIQEKLRLKMEGWTIHGSGLQDPRADLFWDPAVMTAASNTSPFYTNIPSSNSPLLINTLIPSNNNTTKKFNYLDSLISNRNNRSLNEQIINNHLEKSNNFNQVLSMKNLSKKKNR